MGPREAMAVLDVARVSRDLIRALRGKRSQPAFSRLLGYRSNTVYSWESGRRYPEVSLFLRAALSTGHLARRDLARFFDMAQADFEGRRGHSPRVVMQIVQKLVGTAAKTSIAAQLEVDRTTLGRWYTGRTEPRLPEFLALTQLATQRLLQFVAMFVDPAELPSTRAVYADFQRQRRLAYDLPLSHAVLRALELRAYRALPLHSSRFLADEVGISERDVDRYLHELAGAGQAVHDGTHYAVADILTIDTREDPEQNRRLKAFWAREALERFSSHRTDAKTLFSFNLFAISDEAFQRIRELHLSYYDQVRSIVEQSKTADRIVLMNMQLVPMHTPQDEARNANSPLEGAAGPRAAETK